MSEGAAGGFPTGGNPVFPVCDRIPGVLIVCPKRMKDTERRQEFVFALAGLCGVCLYYFLENIALTYTNFCRKGVGSGQGEYLYLYGSGYYGRYVGSGSAGEDRRHVGGNRIDACGAAAVRA